MPVSSFHNRGKISTAHMKRHSNVTGAEQREKKKEQCGWRDAIIRQVNRRDGENRLELCVVFRH